MGPVGLAVVSKVALSVHVQKEVSQQGQSSVERALAESRTPTEGLNPSVCAAMLK